MSDCAMCDQAEAPPSAEVRKWSPVFVWSLSTNQESCPLCRASLYEPCIYCCSDTNGTDKSDCPRIQGTCGVCFYPCTFVAQT